MASERALKSNVTVPSTIMIKVAAHIQSMLGSGVSGNERPSTNSQQALLNCSTTATTSAQHTGNTRSLRLVPVGHT